MPNVFYAFGYSVYFWSSEGNPIEPIHIHISKGNPSRNAPKFWLTESGIFIPASTDYNKFRDLQRVIEKFMAQGRIDVLKEMWINKFNLSSKDDIKYYK